MNNKFKSAIAFGGFIIFVIITGVIFSDGSIEISQTAEEQIVIDDSENQELEKEKKICVYIIGAVENPGIAIVPENSRLYEAVESVGGFLEGADTDLINLASIVNDEEKIIIPFKEIVEKVEQAETTSKISDVKKVNELYHNDAQSNAVLVNINTASKEELKTLSGIGESTAEKIIEYRNSVSKFKNIEEIKNVSGIGDSKFNSIKDKITT